MDQEEPASDSSGSEGRLLQPRSLPILLLLHQWAADEGTLVNTRLILYLLQCLQSLYWTSGRGEFQSVTIKGILSKISAITKLSIQYKLSLGLTSTSLSELMRIFDCLDKLITAQDENTPPILDQAISCSVFAGFLRQCVLEYKELSFAQLRILHNRWSAFLAVKSNWAVPLTIKQKDHRLSLTETKRSQNYTESLKTLTLSRDHSGKNGNKLELEDKALELAMVLTHFNHKEEGRLALNEAIRLAQLSENPFVLEYSLALLQKTTPLQSHDTTALLQQFVKNAEKLQKPLLMSTGKLQLAKTQLRAAAKPTKVLRSIQTCSFDVFQSQERRSSKCAVRAASLLLTSSSWSLYGHSRLSLLPLQLLCQMAPVSFSHLVDPQLEVFVKAVISLARTMEDDGRGDQAVSLAQATLTHLSQSSSSQSKRTLMVYYTQLLATQASQCGDYSALALAVAKLESLDSFLAQYWQARMMKEQGRVQLAMETSQTLLQELRSSFPSADKGHRSLEVVKLEVKTLLLQSGIFMCEDQVTLALLRATECLSLCHQHNLLQLAAQSKLQLATAQLVMCSPQQASDTLMECLPTLLAHGSQEDRARVSVLLAQIELYNGRASAGQEEGQLSVDSARSALDYLQQAREDPTIISFSLLQQILVLEANIYHSLGETHERDRTSQSLIIARRQRQHQVT